MLVKLLEYTDNPEQAIAEAASYCYGSVSTPEKNRQRLLHIMTHEHYSALRYANATFLISGISRVCSHQIVRTAHAGFLQQSQRYTSCVDATCVIPDSLIGLNDLLTTAVNDALLATQKAYQLLVEAGIPKEDARYVLPQGASTQLVMTGNFQMWHNWLKARTSKCAQWEIRNVAIAIKGMLAILAPNIFVDAAINHQE